MFPRALVSLATLLGLLTAASGYAQGTAPATREVSLYFSANASGPVAKTLPAADPALASAMPVSDPAKSAAGWQSFSMNGPFSGYARSNTARKDTSLRPGTPIYAMESESSPVIGHAADTPPTYVDNVRGRDWFQVTFPGPATVYFQTMKAAPPPPPPAPAPAPTPVVVQAAPPPAVVATASGNDASSLPRFYVGVLKLRTNPLYGGPAEARYFLVGNDGQMLALVDLTNVILPGPADDFLGKRVRIYGVTQPANGSLVALLKAQLIQLN
jgi:hypothetical protein